jgi:hypothetical protein
VKRSIQPRSAAQLSEPVNRHLSQYALAASAAGMGMLALAPPTECLLPAGVALAGLLAAPQAAHAKIVYTKTHQLVNRKNGTLDIDLNHDGVVDFKLAIHRLSGSYGAGALTVYQFNSGNTVRFSGTGAAAYPAGIRIGPTGLHERPPKTSQGIMMEYGCYHKSRCLPSFGNWLRVENKYLGLAFLVDGKTHYGWARVSATIVPPGDSPSARLTGYAYEAIPNKAIITGKTKGPDVITVNHGSLGALAAGTSQR